MTDDEILETISRRLHEVDDHLPPTPIGPAIAATAAHGSVRPSAVVASGLLIAVAACVMVVIAEVGMLSRPGRPTATGAAAIEATPTPSQPITRSPRSLIETADPDPSLPPGPTPAGYESRVVDGLEIISGDWDGDALLMYRMGWGPCSVGVDVLTRGPDTLAIDAAADEAGIDSGLLPGGDVALGGSLEAAARAFGSPVLTTDGWIAIGDSGRRLSRWQTPKGRTAWIPLARIAPVPCPSEVGVPSASPAGP